MNPKMRKSPTPIADSMRNALIREQTLFVIAPTGKGYYVENDVPYTVEEFNQKYPVKLDFNLSEENADSTKRWMQC